MALAATESHPSGDSDVKNNQCLNEDTKKKVTFDDNLIKSEIDKKIENSSTDQVDFELPSHVVYKLYLNRLLSAFADRTWDFACGIFVIKLWPESLFLAGVQGILTAISLILVSLILVPVFLKICTIT